MSTLVETITEEPTLALAKHLADLSLKPEEQSALVDNPEVARFIGRTETLYSEENWVELVAHLLGATDAVFEKDLGERDVESAFTIIANLVSKSSSRQDQLTSAEAIAAKLSAKPTDRPALRLRLLFFVYNQLKHPYGRYTIYAKALGMALEGKVPELVIPTLRKLDALVKEWAIGVKEQRNLYLLATKILREGKTKDSKDAFNFLVKYLSTFGKDEAGSAEAKEGAARAAVDYIKAPDAFQSDLLELAPVQALEKDSEHAPLFELLQIFLTKTVDAYLAWEKTHGALLKKLGLSHEDNLTKSRLLSLSALGTQTTSGEISYKQVEETLQIEEDDVELWIVRAIAAKVLEAKLDQLRQVVVINRTTQRVFGAAQWKDLQSRLASWQQNLEHVSNVLHRARASGQVIPNGLQEAVH
jgi:translation initiation factor 3 subunit M